MSGLHFKVKQFIRPGYLIQVPGPPQRGRRRSYRWVQGWQVFDPLSGRWSFEMRYSDALKAVHKIKIKHT